MLTSGAFFAILTYVLMLIGFERIACVRQVKAEILQIETALNEAGYDLAYEDLDFSSIFPLHVLSAKNVQIYSLRADKQTVWKIPQIKLYAGLFSCNQIKVKLAPVQHLLIGEKDYRIKVPELNIRLDFRKNLGISSLIAEAKNTDISDIASIGKWQIASRRIAPQQVNELAPFFENFIELQNIKLNGLLDYPLSQKIERLYMNANIIGNIGGKDSYYDNIQNWVKRGGVVDIKKLIINWDPMVMVARGDMSFSTKLHPELHLRTSSKALGVLLRDLQQKELLENKGLFVVNILLANKAFKMNEDDKYLTVTTPIDIQDNQLKIENIRVKTFHQNGQK